MAFYDKFPYTNFQELNLDKIILALKTMEEELKEFISNNVIKYADPIQWDITKQYEANTVVADSEGNAYISSQPVPVGVALSNTEYWSQIGNFDALFNVIKNAISPYNVPMLGSTATAAQPVNDLLWVGDNLYKTTAAISAGDTIAAGTNVTESNINVRIREIMNALTTNINSVRNDYAAADAETRAIITANQNSNNARFTAIENQLTALQDKYYIFVGDSVAEGWTPDGNTTPFPILFKNKNGIANDHFFNINAGGAGFCNGTTYLQQLTSLYNTIPDHSKITDIFVIGGRNDFGKSDQDILDAKTAFINYAKLNYPNAVVHVGCVGRSFEYIAATEMRYQYYAYAAYCWKTEELGGTNMYNLPTCLDDSQFFASDAKHPNQNGQDAIFNAIMAIMKGGIFQQSKVIYPTLKASGISTTAGSGDISMTEVNGIVTIVLYDRELSVTPTQVGLNRVYYEIGYFDHMLAPGANYRTYAGYGTVVLNISGSFYTVPAMYWVQNNKLYISLTGTNDSHNGYLSGELRMIQIKGIHIAYNAIRGE